jgi:tetratricopeptide (TPR) repeat protein
LIELHQSENCSGPGEEADLEKAIEIKRRAQRHILNGDLDGALNEYEKLVATGDSDPYHSVLLADLLYKKGDHEGAARRYFEAVDGYERLSLFKNAIAVCKKMSRLSLSAEVVIRRLASLHAQDGLATESTLYYMQHAELVFQRGDLAQAMTSFQDAFKVCPDNVKALERLGEVQAQGGSNDDAARTLLDAASHFERLAQLMDAKRCRSRAEELAPHVATSSGPHAPIAAPTPAEGESEDRQAPSPVAANGRSVGRTSDPALTATPPIEQTHDDDSEARVATSPQPPLELERGAAALQSQASNGIPADDGTDASHPGSAPREHDVFGTPGRPGLQFDDPASDSASTATAGASGLPEVSMLLQEAQALFERGEREAAGATLVRAAQAYDRLGRLDSAASIYRSLSRLSETPLQVMMLWLKNCQRRDDRTEAARVACELGDRALIDGDTAGAREWFERARAFDDRNEVAARRLERLIPGSGTGQVVTTPEAAPAPPTAPEPELVREEEPAEPPAEGARAQGVAVPNEDPGIVEVSLDQDTSMSLDLGVLIAEFQRGLDSQLASDPQGHYDLAMSYREMGLFDEAILSFQLAAQDPKLCVRATELIGRCHLDRGDFDEAARQLQRAIAMPGLDASATLELVLQLGLALEAGGHTREALRQFERIYSEEPSFPDVAQKIRALRKALEQE